MATKKDYELIATVIREAKDNHSHDEHDGTEIDDSNGAILDIAEAFAFKLEEENPNFNRVLFLTECGF